MQPGKVERRHAGGLRLSTAVETMSAALAELSLVDLGVMDVTSEVMSRLTERTTEVCCHTYLSTEEKR